jgi:hypothetical protein
LYCDLAQSHEVRLQFTGFHLSYNGTKPLSWRMNMQEQSFGRMTSDNVEEFEVRILDSPDLVVSIVLVRAPWSVIAEQYLINQ